MAYFPLWLYKEHYRWFWITFVSRYLVSIRPQSAANRTDFLVLQYFMFWKTFSNSINVTMPPHRYSKWLYCKRITSRDVKRLRDHTIGQYFCSEPSTKQSSPFEKCISIAKAGKHFNRYGQSTRSKTFYESSESKAVSFAPLSGSVKSWALIRHIGLFPPPEKAVYTWTVPKPGKTCSSCLMNVLTGLALFSSSTAPSRHYHSQACLIISSHSLQSCRVTLCKTLH